MLRTATMNPRFFALRVLSALLLFGVSVAAASPAAAEESAGSGAAQPAPSAPASRGASEAAAAPAPGQPAGSLDFDLFNDQPKLDPAAQAVAAAKAAALDRKVQVRRRVLVAHQIIGFTTLALMTATVILGQINYVARYGGFNDGQDYDRYQTAHLGLSVTTSALFTTLGVLGLAAPNPYPKPIKLDSALVHKVAMALATAGMVTQLILGPVTAYYEGRVEQRNLALGHVITGYATWGFMAAGVLAYVF